MSTKKDERETTLRVAGMTCGSCGGRVERALRAIAGVTGVQVHVADGLARVTHDGVSDEALCAAVASAGYEASPR